MPEPRGRRDPLHSFLRWRKRSGAHPAPLRTGSTDRERQATENSPSAKSQPASASLLPKTLQQLVLAGYLLLSCESKVMANSIRVPREWSVKHKSFGLPARSDSPLSSPLLQTHATCPATTTGTPPSVWGPVREDRMGNDVGTSPISLNLHARAGACFPPDTNTSSPKPFSCKGMPSNYPASSQCHLWR